METERLLVRNDVASSDASADRPSIIYILVYNPV
jgi:hypothetical protein